MEFGPRPLTECLNAILAHTAFVKDGRIAKGTRLNSDHLERLEAAGIKQLVVANLEDNELDEDDAASQLAAALMPTNVRLSEAKTGRLNIYARDRGLLRFDRKKLRAINLINEGVTLATVQHNQLVEAGDMIATLKIIPYGVPQSVVADVIAYTDHCPILTFHAIRPRSFSLIQTRVPGMKDQIFKTTEETTKARLNQLGCALVDSRIVAHTPDAVKDAIHNTEQYGPDGFLICGASAIADRRDVVPAGILAAGGKVDHLGMPVDPGNLLMMARINDKPIVGMPGCARSPRLNGFDWVLHLLLADLPVDNTEIADMAAGGLLMEIASRPLPRKMTERKQLDQISIGAVLLAAGESRRMGETNKLMLEIDSVPVIRRTAINLIDAGIKDIVVVTGHQKNMVTEALQGLPLRFSHNANYSSGQATSLACGILQLAANAHGAALIALGDMPFVSAELITALLHDHASLSDAEHRISFPVFAGRRGNPVIWGKTFFEQLTRLSGDIGGRTILAQHRNAANSLSWHDNSIHQDIDAPDDFYSSG